MIEDGQLVLSSLLLGIALSGLVVGLRRRATLTEGHWLTMIFAALALISSLPVSALASRSLYVFHLPALLPCLLVFPILVMGYVHSRMINRCAPRLSRYHWLFPGSGLLVMIGYWLQPSGIKDTLFVRGELPAESGPAVLTLATFILLGIWCLVSLLYIWRVGRSLRKYRAQLKASYSNMDGLDLRWIDSFLLLIVSLWAVTLLVLVSDNIGRPIPFAGPIILILAAATFLTLMGFAMTEAPLGKRVETADPTPSSNVSRPKYEKSSLSDAQADRIAQRIEKMMERDALYLDPSLSLGKLAASVQAPENLVSQTINTRLGTTFFDYVAHWRVKAALPLVLKDTLPILDIALRVGFNTRSTFYKAFKRETGLTPSAYRHSIAKTDRDSSEDENKTPNQ